MSTTTPATTAGTLLRDWRTQRRMSQLDLSLQAGISARHISFVETGRSRPSAELIERLADHLDIPLTERNAILLAGGYAPAHSRHDLGGPELESVRVAVRHVLDGHEPYPAALIDHRWELVDANAAISVFTAVADPRLLEPPVNALRLSLHPDGMAPYILNLAQWRAHLLHRLSTQASATGDRALSELHQELSTYPGDDDDTAGVGDLSEIAVPLRFRHSDEILTFLSTTTVFGTPRDITIAGLAIEAFLPADAGTRRVLTELSEVSRPL